MSRIYSNWIKQYMEFASFSEAPDKLHFWTAVGTIAGALRRRVWIDQGYFQWVPNFYIVFVAPPGIVSKSTTADIGMSMLHEIEGINFGPEAVTWQSLVQSMAQSTEAFPLPDGAFMPMSAITCVASEFGTFLNPHDREMVDVLVSLWDGRKGAFVKGTKTQGTDIIQNPWINVMACTTPAWLTNNLPDYMIYGGFCSRCIFVYADKKKQLVALPRRHIPPDFAETRVKLIHDLEVISTLCGEMDFSPEAVVLMNEWYEEHHNNRPKNLNTDRFGGYLARKQTHAVKLSMVLTASKYDSLIIQREELAFALDMITALEASMPMIYGGIGADSSSKHVRRLLELIDNNGPITMTDLYKLCFREIGYDDYIAAIRGVQQTGYVVQDNANNAIVFRINPNVKPGSASTS